MVNCVYETVYLCIKQLSICVSAIRPTVFPYLCVCVCEGLGVLFAVGTISSSLAVCLVEGPRPVVDFALLVFVFSCISTIC